MFLTLLISTGCSSVEVEGGEEAVLVMQPYIFGHGGVDPTPIKTGQVWVALSTQYHIYNMKPVQHTTEFNDLITADNNPVDFNAYVETQIQTGKSALIHGTWGRRWFEEKVNEKFRTYIRNFARSQSMFELTTNASVTTLMEQTVFEKLTAYITKQEMPISINRITVGKISPPQAVLDETVRTAQQKQRVKTERATELAEIQRKHTQIATAVADLAYKKKFGMTNDEYLALRRLEIDANLVDIIRTKDGLNVLVNVGGTNAIVNAGRR